MPQDYCAYAVYGICGLKFTKELKKHPGYNPVELCKVFVDEGGCINKTATDISCDSNILKRFKRNSEGAAKIILPVICVPSPWEVWNSRQGRVKWEKKELLLKQTGLTG